MGVIGTGTIRVVINWLTYLLLRFLDTSIIWNNLQPQNKKHPKSVRKSTAVQLLETGKPKREGAIDFFMSSAPCSPEPTAETLGPSSDHTNKHAGSHQGPGMLLSNLPIWSETHKSEVWPLPLGCPQSLPLLIKKDMGVNIYLLRQPLGPHCIAVRYIKHIRYDYPKLHERLHLGSLLLVAQGRGPQNTFFFF